MYVLNCGKYKCVHMRYRNKIYFNKRKYLDEPLEVRLLTSIREDIKDIEYWKSAEIANERERQQITNSTTSFLVGLANDPANVFVGLRTYNN